MAYTPAAQGGAGSSTTLADATFLVPTSLGSPGTPTLVDVTEEPYNAFGGGGFAKTIDVGEVKPTFESSDVLAQKLYQMSMADLANLQTQLKLAGYGNNIISTGMVDSATLNGYGSLLKDTAAYAAAGGQGYTPDTLLAAKVAATNELEEDEPGSALTDPLVAQRLVDNSLQRHLGRKATAQERQSFAALLQSYAANDNASETGATQLADNYTLSDQGRADEAGALNQTRFVDVLHNLMAG